METQAQVGTTDEHPVDRAARQAGGRRALALELRVTEAAIGNWKARGVPAEHCPAIEGLTGVRCEELRPDIGWSVLRGTDPTPKPIPPDQPTEQGVANA